MPQIGFPIAKDIVAANAAGIDNSNRSSCAAHIETQARLHYRLAAKHTVQDGGNIVDRRLGT